MKKAAQFGGFKSLILLEAAIGIEPMNKGFAGHIKAVSQSITEHQEQSFTEHQNIIFHSVTLHVCRCLLHFSLQ